MDESGLANKLVQDFGRLIDEADAEAIAMAKFKEDATLVTGERSTKMPDVAAQYNVRCITPSDFLRERPGARVAR
jgi:hypothetical protein